MNHADRSDDLEHLLLRFRCSGDQSFSLLVLFIQYCNALRSLATSRSVPVVYRVSRLCMPCPVLRDLQLPVWTGWKLLVKRRHMLLESQNDGAVHKTSLATTLE